MRIFRCLSNIKRREPCILTIGNFDGVHRGHQTLLARAREESNSRGLPLTVMTFEPHPREFFNPDNAPCRITLLRDKINAFNSFGVDRVFIAHFGRSLASLSPDAFVKEILVSCLHVNWVLVGDDFHYGANRIGNFHTLFAAGVYYGFEVEHMNTFANINGVRISSSAVRAALISGDLNTAEHLLGRSYAISGRVIHGRKIGRDLGFPTLNLRIPHKRPAITGIFVVRVFGLTEFPLPGVASMGMRPTVDDSGRFLLEIHVLDWDGNAYGKLICVKFLWKLRDEERYIDISTLITAIEKDVENTRAWFNREYFVTNTSVQVNH